MNTQGRKLPWEGRPALAGLLCYSVVKYRVLDEDPGGRGPGWKKNPKNLGMEGIGRSGVEWAPRGSGVGDGQDLCGPRS